MTAQMKIKITINRPRTMIEGWTGFVTLPSGRRINLVDYCGGAVVAFNSKADLVRAAKRVAQANFERAEA
jgi:hypothetical protein